MCINDTMHLNPHMLRLSVKILLEYVGIYSVFIVIYISWVSCSVQETVAYEVLTDQTY